MADYNVNMKQWNGTSFDNVLPLAYNAKQLEGQSLAEVKQWVQDNNLLLYTGSYRGTGTYGESHPTSIKFPFEPIIWFTPERQYYNMSSYGIVVLSMFGKGYHQRQFRGIIHQAHVISLMILAIPTTMPPLVDMI